MRPLPGSVKGVARQWEESKKGLGVNGDDGEWFWSKIVEWKQELSVRI
jgi:hypothetical protein